MNASDIIEDAIKHAAKRPLKLAKVYENYVYQLKQTMKNIEQQIHLMNRSSLLHFHQFQKADCKNGSALLDRVPPSVHRLL